MSTTNEALLRNFLQKVWNEKDTASIPLFINDAYTIHLDPGDPWEGKTLDHTEFRARLRHSFDPFPNIHFEISTAISDSDYVAITWTLTGTNLGSIGQFGATHRKINVQGATIYYFKDGKISGHSQVFDRTLVAKQLGFIK